MCQGDSFSNVLFLVEKYHFSLFKVLLWLKVRKVLLLLVHFGICIRFIFGNLKNSSLRSSNSFKFLQKSHRTDSQSSPNKEANWYQWKKPHIHIASSIILLFFLFFSSVCEFIRISQRRFPWKMTNCLSEAKRNEFLSFRKSSCYWFKKRNMEDSEGFLVLFSQEKYVRERKLWKKYLYKEENVNCITNKITFIHFPSSLKDHNTN